MNRGIKRDRPTNNKNSRSHRLVKERRAKMKDVEELVKALETIHQQVNVDIHDSTKVQNTHEDDNEVEFNSLSDKFLDECDHDLKQLD